MLRRLAGDQLAIAVPLASRIVTLIQVVVLTRVDTLTQAATLEIDALPSQRTVVTTRLTPRRDVLR